MTYSTVAIIYNPNSTGSSKTLAEKFQTSLVERIPDQKVELIPTEYRGHAEKLAYTFAKEYQNPLIISSSGDGGYHEVVNGAIKAQNEGSTPVVGLLPAGNANDHFHNIHNEDIIDMMIAGKTKSIDLLKISYLRKGAQKERYAHSYIGFGLTPIVGAELNKTKLNVFKETWFVIRALVTWKPVRFKIDNDSQKYDSIIISNVDKMSKYLNVSHPSRVDDGLFEVTTLKHESRFKLIFTILQASFSKLKEDTQTSSFSLYTKRKALAQADGELIKIDEDSHVSITIEKQILRCLV